MKLGALLFMLTAGTVSLIIGLLGCLFFLAVFLSAQYAFFLHIDTIAVALVFFAFFAAGIFTITNELTAKVILYADAIEVVRSLSRRRLGHDEIAGRRIVRDGLYSTTLILYPRRSGLTRLKISPVMRSDAVLTAWVETLTDLDLQDSRDTAIRAAHFPSEVGADERLGANPTERIARLERARGYGRALTWLARAAAAWCIMLRDPFGLSIAVTAAVPWVAIYFVATSHGTLRIMATRGDPRPNVIEAWVFPALSLMVRAFLGDATFGGVRQLILAAIGAVGMTVVIVVADLGARVRPRQALSLALFAFSYSYGAVVLGNEILNQNAWYSSLPKAPADLFPPRSS